MERGDGGGGGQLWWWLLRSVCAPIALPWLLYKAYTAACLSTKKAHLQDKVVLITGASSGIGEAIAHKFYAQGCRLILAARREDELNRVKNDLLQTRPTLTTHVPYVVPLDLLELDDIKATVVKIIDVYGRIDVLINNAGISNRGTVMDTDISVYMKLMTTNFFSQVVLTKAVLPYMINRKSGHIAFTSSLQAKIALPCRSAYGASKHALQAFCDTLRSEVAKYDIKVSTVLPGYVKTAMSRNALTGNGTKYGKTDKNTQNGDSPDTIADDVMNCIVNDKSQIIRSPFHYHLVYYIRVCLPSLYFKFLTMLERQMTKELS